MVHQPPCLALSSPCSWGFCRCPSADSAHLRFILFPEGDRGTGETAGILALESRPALKPLPHGTVVERSSLTACLGFRSIKSHPPLFCTTNPTQRVCPCSVPGSYSRGPEPPHSTSQLRVSTVVDYFLPQPVGHPQNPLQPRLCPSFTHTFWEVHRLLLAPVGFSLPLGAFPDKLCLLPGSAKQDGMWSSAWLPLGCVPPLCCHLTNHGQDGNLSQTPRMGQKSSPKSQVLVNSISWDDGIQIPCALRGQGLLSFCKAWLRSEEVIARVRVKVWGTRTQNLVYKFHPMLLYFPSHKQDTHLCLHRSLTA